MIRVLKQKKGSSSILVILLLVVLVVFGVAALTTAVSNLRLGQKAADWNDKYYAADAKANEMYAKIDKALSSRQSSELYPYPSGKTLEQITAELSFDVKAQINNETIDFSYEAWEQDVGIDVILSYEIDDSSFYIIQYKAVQKTIAGAKK